MAVLGDEGRATSCQPVDVHPVGKPTSAGPKDDAAAMAHRTGEFDDWSLQVERLIDAGDEGVVALTRQWATGKASGIPVELNLGMVYELKDGCVIRMTNYLTHAEALEAVGLSE